MFLLIVCCVFCFLFFLQAKPIKLIYAYGLTDEITYHQVRRGTKEVNLLNYMRRTPFSNLNYFSAAVDNVRIIWKSYDSKILCVDLFFFLCLVQMNGWKQLQSRPFLFLTGHRSFPSHLLPLQGYEVTNLTYKASHIHGKGHLLHITLVGRHSAALHTVLRTIFFICHINKIFVN